jgi:hypothetical protein
VIWWLNEHLKQLNDFQKKLDAFDWEGEDEGFARSSESEIWRSEVESWWFYPF